MQITLPDDPRFQETAAAAGFASVEEYVKAVLNAEIMNEPTKTETLSDEQWEQSLRSLQAVCKSANPHFDDSRASLYPVRN
jgi:hypothetical protein